MVQMARKILSVLAMPAFKGASDDVGKVAFGRHASGPRLGFKRNGVSLR